MKKLTKKAQREKDLENLALHYALGEYFSEYENAENTYKALQAGCIVESDNVYELYEDWEPSDILKAVSASIANLYEFLEKAKEIQK